MNESAQTTEENNKRITTIVYALQAAGFVIGITFIAAVMLNYIKREDVAASWLDSHFRWQIRTFWFGLLWSTIGVALFFVGIGVAILGVNALWIIYRIIKGWLRLSENKPMYVEAGTEPSTD
jgi:uncharacterized membrane protein